MLALLNRVAIQVDTRDVCSHCYKCVCRQTLQESQAVADASTSVGTENGGDWDGVYPHATGHDLQRVDISKCLFRSRSWFLCLPPSPTVLELRRPLRMMLYQTQTPVVACVCVCVFLVHR